MYLPSGRSCLREIFLDLSAFSAIDISIRERQSESDRHEKYDDGRRQDIQWCIDLSGHLVNKFLLPLSTGSQFAGGYGRRAVGVYVRT